jgi:thioredoxin reductase
VLVVGGGDAAVEAALAIAGEPGTRVTLSYRGETFIRLKTRNRERLAEAARAGTLSVLLRSIVLSIGEHDATLDQDGGKIDLANDAVIICAGGIMPTPMLKEIGIKVETKYGTE